MKTTNLEFLSSVDGLEIEKWKHTLTGDIYEVPIEIVRDFDSAELSKESLDSNMWVLIEAIKWNKPGYTDVRTRKFLNCLTDITRDELEAFIDEKVDILKFKYNPEEIENEIGCGCDAWDDLCAEAVSRGKDFLLNLEIRDLAYMYKTDSYKQNFKYIFQND